MNGGRRFMALGALIGAVFVRGAFAETVAPPTTVPSTTAPRRSGYEFMSAPTQAMQRDDAANPSMLWVDDGATLWRQVPAAGVAACSSCHGRAESSMRGVAARYPVFDTPSQRPVTLAQRINLCRLRHQRQTPFILEGRDLLSLEAYVARQSRGMSIAPPSDARLSAWRARGRALFDRRIGQLNLACAHCHDERAGERLGGSVIPQAHPTGYPAYRLEWQAAGSLQRRLRGCVLGVRAEPFAVDAIEWVELELYLMTRAAGMTMETPAVRP